MRHPLVSALALVPSLAHGAGAFAPLTIGDFHVFIPVAADEVVVDFDPNSNFILDSNVDGSALSYIGDKDENGLPTQITAIAAASPKDPSEALNLYFDESGRVSSVWSPSGSIDLEYQTGDEIVVTITDTEGRSEALQTSASIVSSAALAPAAAAPASVRGESTRLKAESVPLCPECYTRTTASIQVHCDDNYIEHGRTASAMTVGLMTGSLFRRAEVALGSTELTEYQTPKQFVTYDYTRSILTEKPQYSEWQPFCEATHHELSVLQPGVGGGIAQAARNMQSQSLTDGFCGRDPDSAPCRILAELREAMSTRLLNLVTRLDRLLLPPHLEHCTQDDWERDWRRSQARLSTARIFLTKRFRQYTYPEPSNSAEVEAARPVFDLRSGTLPDLRLDVEPPATDVTLELFQKNPDYGPGRIKYIPYLRPDLTECLELPPDKVLYFKAFDNFYDHNPARLNEANFPNERYLSQSYACARYELELRQNGERTRVHSTFTNQTPDDRSITFGPVEESDVGQYRATLRVQNHRMPLPVSYHLDFQLCSADGAPTPHIKLSSPSVGLPEFPKVPRADVRFDASMSTGVDLSYRWSVVPFGDLPTWEGIEFSSSPVLSASGEAGRYRAWLQVRDGRGNVSEDSRPFQAIEAIRTYTFSSKGAGWTYVPLDGDGVFRYTLLDFEDGDYFYGSDRTVYVYETDAPETQVWSFPETGPGSWGPRHDSYGLAGRTVLVAF